MQDVGKYCYEGGCFEYPPMLDFSIVGDVDILGEYGEDIKAKEVRLLTLTVFSENDFKLEAVPMGVRETGQDDWITLRESMHNADEFLDIMPEESRELLYKVLEEQKEGER